MNGDKFYNMVVRITEIYLKLAEIADLTRDLRIVTRVHIGG